MTPLGWLALAAAGTVLGRGGTGDRVSRLVARGRLGGRRPVGAPARWRSAGALLGDALPRRTGRRAAARRRDLRVAMAALTAELTAGGRPADALTAAAEAAPGFAERFAAAARAARGGGEVAAVLAGGASTAGLACAWHLAERTGAALVVVIDRVAADLDADEDHRRALTVALSGPRSSAAVLAALPVVGLLLGSAMGGRPLHVLFDTPAGSAVGAAGVAFDLAGLWWMGRILRSAGPP